MSSRHHQLADASGQLLFARLFPASRWLGQLGRSAAVDFVGPCLRRLIGEDHRVFDGVGIERTIRKMSTSSGSGCFQFKDHATLCLPGNVEAQITVLTLLEGV